MDYLGSDEIVALRTAINLGDFMPTDAMVRPSDINVTTIITPDGGKVRVDILKDDIRRVS